MLKPTKAALDAILSDDLRYAHSNGKVDTKASPTPSSRIAVATSKPGLARNVSAAALTAF